MDRKIAESLVHSVGKEAPTHPKANPMRGLIPEPETAAAMDGMSDSEMGTYKKLRKKGMSEKQAASMAKKRKTVEGDAEESAGRAKETSPPKEH